MLIGLVKPTDTMRAALNGLGYSSAEQGIATEGLGGLLGSLAKTTDGTTAGLAKLFANQRGIIGVLNIGTLGADKYQEKLKEIRGETNDLTSNRAGQILGTDAQQFEQQANKLKNAFTTGFGESFLHAAVQATQLVGGVETVTSAVGTLSPLLTTGAGLLLAYGARPHSHPHKPNCLGSRLERSAHRAGWRCRCHWQGTGRVAVHESAERDEACATAAFKSASPPPFWLLPARPMMRVYSRP